MTNNNSRLHIGLFGRRNAGKSSIINRLTGQNLSIVSEVAGTTTDPVRKAVEITGLGPVVFVDTAGIDDAGELGGQRVNKTRQAINQVDMAIIVFCENRFAEEEHQLAEQLQRLQTPFILLHNKSDKQPVNNNLVEELTNRYKVDFIDFSAKTGEKLDLLLQLLKNNRPDNFGQLPPLFGDRIKAGNLVLLVTPIDSEAPAGRMILPQVQAIREALDYNCMAVIVKETEVEDFMSRSNIVPALVITDSQLFGRIDKLIPAEIPLTSFSILLARQKLGGSPLQLPREGEGAERQKNYFEEFLKGTTHIDRLQDGDRILVLESCTHHSSCDDIGRVKIPRWLQEYTGCQLAFDIVPGLSEPPYPIHNYAFAIQCGGCMITCKQLLNRIQAVIEANIPITNYGMAIAYIKDSWHRSVELFLFGNI